MTERQKKRRLAWAKERLNWTQRQWDSIIFSDESKFDVSLGDERGKVIRSKQEAFHPDCLKRTVKFPAGIMIWGCMSSRGLGKLHFVDGTVNAVKYQEILKNHLMPAKRKLYRNREVIFQQDGASCHTAKSTMQWLKDNKVEVLDWPSSSPDLNPIENLWGLMKKRLRNDRPMSKSDLKQKLEDVWDKITTEDCQNLINSMHDRVVAVIKAKGDVTRW